MHSINYIHKIGKVVVYGGRNDFLTNNHIMEDIYCLKVHNMEWVKCKISG